MRPEFNVIKTKSLEWSVQLPSSDSPKKSPVFLVKENEFFFRFQLREIKSGSSTIWYYELYIESKCDHEVSCKGNFQVGFKRQQTFTLAGKQEFTISKSGSTRIWYVSFQAMQSNLPGNYVDGNCIKFLICFDEMTESLLDIGDETGHISPDLQLKDSNFCLKSLSRDFGKMLEDGLDHDIEFKCDDRTWKVHKSVLSVRSKVLQAMLNSDMIEGRTGVITLRDMDVETAQQFLNYLYSGKLPEMTVEIAERFYEIGDKYAVDCLKKSCASYLVRNLTPEIACEILIVAHEHNDSAFIESVINFIIVKRIFKNDDLWREFRKRHPEIACEVYDRFCKSDCSQ